MGETLETRQWLSERFGMAAPFVVVERIHKQPECRLLWAVLENAIETYMKYVGARHPRGKRLFQEVEQWIWEEDPTWLCSFVSICYILGIDPDYLRLGLQRWRKELNAALLFRRAA